jgi:hypothetical protein
MLAVAVVALVTVGITGTYLGATCQSRGTVLLETLPALAPPIGNPSFAKIESLVVDGRPYPPSASGAISVDPHGSLEIRGYAADPSARIPVVAVFAVVDGGARTYRATYGADGARRAPAGDFNESRATGYHVVVPAADLSPGAHTIALRAVPRKLDGYYGVGVPLHLMSR